MSGDIRPIVDKETWEAAQKQLKERKAQEPNGAAPLGYKWENGKLVIDETEAEGIRAAFAAAERGEFDKAQQHVLHVRKIRNGKQEKTT